MDKKERQRIYKKEYYEKNKEKLRKKGREYYKENNKKAKTHRKKYRFKNVEQVKKKDREYCQRPEVKERRKEYGKEYRLKNQEKIKKYQKEIYSKEKSQEYYKGHKKNKCLVCGKNAFNTFCSNLCGGKFYCGENSPGWKGGLSFEPYNSKFNNKFKREIRKRDYNLCMLCLIHREKLKKALSVHHIDYNKLNSIKENCISLCGSCHAKTNNHRAYWEVFFKKLLAEKYGYSYHSDVE